MSYKGKIDTYLLLLENLNIKAGLSGIAWRVRVESKLPQEILRHLSHFSFATDEEWMEILRKVGRQEEELLERGKLTKSLTTRHAPPAKGKREELDKGFNTKYEKRGSDNKAGNGPSRWKAPRTNTKQNKNNTVAKDEHTDWKKAHRLEKGIPIGKRHTMESRTMWLRNEKRRNATPVAAWTNTPGENAVSQSWLPQPSHTKIGETLNNHLNQELAHSQYTNHLQHDKNHLRRLTYYDEKDHRKSGNCLIQKCLRGTRRKISKYFLSSVYKSLFISLSGQTRADVTVSLRMTGARASRVLDSRSKQIPLILKASRK